MKLVLSLFYYTLAMLFVAIFYIDLVFSIIPVYVYFEMN